MACPEGIEPPTPSLEGWCSIRLSYGQRAERGVTASAQSQLEQRLGSDELVGAAGFELATYWSQTSCATRLRYAPTDARLYPGGLAEMLDHAVTCAQAFSRRFTLTGCGVRSSCANRLTRNSSRSHWNSVRRASGAPRRSANWRR